MEVKKLFDIAVIILLCVVIYNWISNITLIPDNSVANTYCTYKNIFGKTVVDTQTSKTIPIIDNFGYHSQSICYAFNRNNLAKVTYLNDAYNKVFECTINKQGYLIDCITDD